MLLVVIIYRTHLAFYSYVIVQGIGTEVLSIEGIRDKREALAGWIADFGIGSAVFDSGLLQDLMEETVMLSVRVWNLQSDGDAKAVRFLENEFLRFRKLGDIAIRTAGRSTLRKCHRKGTLLEGSFRKAIRYYLKQDDYIIFRRWLSTNKDNQNQNHLLSKSDVSSKMEIFPTQSFSCRIFKNVGTLYQQSGSASFRVFRAEVESERKTVFGRSGIGP